MKPYEPFQHALPVPQQAAPVVRFLTAGSVDDGKSTLIGRLLFDSKAVLADQVTAIERAKHKRTEAGVLDLSLLTDGLEAEREQGITIDVAYRYFSNGLTKFIVADAPGHEQYTRNMVTAASNSEAIVLLIDPTRVPLNAQGQAELLPQTRRHAAIAALLGLPHVAVAVNKMDRVGFDPAVFERIREAALALTQQLRLPAPQVIPMSALNGDNVVFASETMPWYPGPTLLDWLSGLGAPTAAPSKAAATHPARFLVQRVQRAYQAVDAIQTLVDRPANGVDGIRGLQGVLTQGRLRVGDAVHLLAGDQPVTATVAALQGLGGQVAEASADTPRLGVPLTVFLAENLDAPRGAVLEGTTVGSTSQTRPTPHRPLELVGQFEADICWLDTAALSPAKRYWLQLGTARVQAKVTAVIDTLDLSQLARVTAAEPALQLNQIGRVRLVLATPLPATPLAVDADPSLSRFILIDPGSFQTAAAGLVR